MSIKLKAFLTGALGAVEAKFDEERETTKASLANRTKNAYTNYQTYQEQTAALKEEIKKRDSEATSYQADLTEEERIAIGSDSSNVFLSSYKTVLAAGNPMKKTLRDFIVKKQEGASAQNYSDWVQAATTKQPAPVSAKLEESSFFGISPKVQQRQLDRAAGSVGLTSDQLMAFEQQADKPMLTPTASLNAAASELPKSAAESQEILLKEYTDSADDPVKRKAVMVKIEAFAKDMEKFDEASGDTDHAAIFTANRFKAFNIKSRPTEFSAEDNAFADNFLLNDGKRERQAQLLAAQAQRAFSLGQPLDLTGIITAAVRNDLAMIPSSKNARGADVFVVNGAKLPEGSPEVLAMLQGAKVNAATRILRIGSIVDENGMFKAPADQKLVAELSAQGIDLTVVDGKQYIKAPTASQPAPVGGASVVMSAEDKAAKAWATANSTDPRAAGINDNINRKYPGLK